MQFRKNLSYPAAQGHVCGLCHAVTIRFALGACLAATAVLTAAQQAPVPPGGALRYEKASLPTAINQPPDANVQMSLRQQQGKQQNFAAANAERKKLIAADCVKLLRLVADLKAEVAMTPDDSLSIDLIRKTEEIEKLAHSVKEMMKLSVGAG